MKSKVITLCGSVRFEDWFKVCAAELTLRGWVVLGPEVWMHQWLHDANNTAMFRITHRTKEELDKLHKKKILRSRAIFVVDVLGYTGYSTKEEISFAIDHGIEVYKWSRGELFHL